VFGAAVKRPPVRVLARGGSPRPGARHGHDDEQQRR
jgi:hypothetical protein